MELSKDKYGSPRISGEILDCSMPMTFDSYSNCGFNCLYCFSTYQRGIGGSKKNYWAKNKIKAVSVDRFKKLFDPNYNSQFKYIIQNRKPMQWGGLSDPFCPIEEKFGVGYEILKFLAEKQYPVSFSSKSDLVLRNKKYWDILMANKNNIHYKTTIITLDEKIASVMEAGAPSPSRRLEVLKALSDAGINTTLRLRPFVIGVSDKTYVELINKAINAGIKSISTEFFCLEGRANALIKNKFAVMSKLCGFNIVDFYKKGSQNSSGYLRLNYKTKAKYVKVMKEICEKRGIRLHVSDAHHKELTCTGSCCGLPDNHPTLSNYQKSQFTNAIVKARKNGTVRFSEISDDFEWLKSFKWCEATCFNTGDTNKRNKKQDFTMYEYMRNQWNNPKSNISPYKYFGGVMKPIGLDENKDVIYKYVGMWRQK